MLDMIDLMYYVYPNQDMFSREFLIAVYYKGYVLKQVMERIQDVGTFCDPNRWWETRYVLFSDCRKAMNGEFDVQ